MKASELIIELRKAIKKRGDLPVMYNDYMDDIEIEKVEYYTIENENPCFFVIDAFKKP